jgi:hypothetical protein
MCWCNTFRHGDGMQYWSSSQKRQWICQSCLHVGLIIFLNSYFYHEFIMNATFIVMTNRMSEIVAARQSRPWIQPNFLFQMSEYSTKQRKVLGVLHGFTDDVSSWLFLFWVGLNYNVRMRKKQNKVLLSLITFDTTGHSKKENGTKTAKSRPNCHWKYWTSSIRSERRRQFFAKYISQFQIQFFTKMNQF